MALQENNCPEAAQGEIGLFRLSKDKGHAILQHRKLGENSNPEQYQ